MAVSKLTCPECKTVLRPAKPLPPGKAVKCPECGTRFAAPDDAPNVPLKKPKRAAEVKTAPRKPAAKAASGAAPAVSRKDDEDDEGGVYRFADGAGGGSGAAAGEEDEEKPEINYAPDMSIKDLRGPAQLALNAPSNALIATAALGFFGWVGLLFLLLIPTLFPVQNDDGNEQNAKPVVGLEHGLGAIRDEKGPGSDIANDPARRSMFNFFGVDIAMFGALGIVIFLLILSPIFVGMIYSAIVAYGAVKVQNLEGYRWGIASSIMVMLPINSFGFMSATSILLNFLLGMVVDDKMGLRGLLGGIMGLETLICVAIGAWVLVTLRSERVLKGYAYKPD